MNASMKRAADFAAINLIRLSAARLIDDTRLRLVIPLRPATATIRECLDAKRLAVN